MEQNQHYPLLPFQCRDTDKFWTIIQRYPLATLSVSMNEWPEVIQVPLIFLDSERRVLLGHVDNNNPFLRFIHSGACAHCLFSGPNSYISPSIYPDQQYPGWNYFSVHLRGRLRVIDQQQILEKILLETAKQNEAVDSPYELTPDQDNFGNLLNYITAFAFDIEEQRGILKLSQDKSTSNTELARQELVRQSSKDIGQLLRGLLA